MANGLVFITTSSFTTAASVSINNCFSATYTHYIIKRNLLGSSANAELTVRMRVGGVDASGASYQQQRSYAIGATVASQRNGALTSWTVTGGWTEATAFGYSELWMSNPFEAVRTTAWGEGSYDADASIELQQVVLTHDPATSYDGFTTIPSAGTITGSISVWGLAKA